MQVDFIASPPFRKTGSDLRGNYSSYFFEQTIGEQRWNFILTINLDGLSSLCL
jgi:hypothetical protein